MTDTTRTRSGAKDDSEGAEAIPVGRLVTEAQDFLGVEPHVVAGALHGQRKSELTVDECRALVEKWLSTPVKED